MLRRICNCYTHDYDGNLYRNSMANKLIARQLASLDMVRLRRFHEGRCAQVLRIGHYGAYGAAEAPTVSRLHRFIEEHGYTLNGKHHEIYLNDPRRTAPEKLKTVVRQPMSEL